MIYLLTFSFILNIIVISGCLYYFNNFKKKFYNAGAERAFNEMKKYADKIQYRKLAQLYLERKHAIMKNLN